MKRYVIVVMTVLIISALSYSVIAITSKQSNGLIGALDNSIKQGKDVGVSGVPSPISGHIFTGNYLRVGINNLGTLGVTNGTKMGDPGVGFQASSDIPFQWPSTESVATGWWGEGYVVAYEVLGIDKVAYWQPGFGYPCSGCNVKPISNKIVTNTPTVAIKEVKVKTSDDNLTITFAFIFRKDLPTLKLETNINNTGTKRASRIIYKRIVDWDVCGFNGNTWASSSTEVYAWGYCNDPIRSTIQLTMAGHDGISNIRDVPIVNYVDLNAWDDQNIRGPAFPIQSSTPIVGDYNAAIYYDIGGLNPGENKTIHTIYQISTKY